MTKKAKTAVVIVNYNTQHFLRDCLQSCLYSSVPLHIVIIDNDSADDSIAQAKQLTNQIETQFHHIEFVENDQNIGFSAAINQACQQVSEEYIMLLNPDCSVYQDTFSKLETFMQQCPDAAIAGALVFNQDGSEQKGCRRREPTLTSSIVTLLKLERFVSGINMTNEALPKQAISVDAVSGAAMMIRKTVFDQVGGMDETFFLHCEDLDICRTVRHNTQSPDSNKVYFCPQVSVIHYQGKSSQDVPFAVASFKYNSMILYNEKHHADMPKLYQLALRYLVKLYLLLLLLWLTLKKYLFTLAKETTISAPIFNTLVFLSAENTISKKVVLADNETVNLHVSTMNQQKPSMMRIYRLKKEFFDKVPATDVPPMTDSE